MPVRAVLLSFQDRTRGQLVGRRWDPSDLYSLSAHTDAQTQTSASTKHECECMRVVQLEPLRFAHTHTPIHQADNFVVAARLRDVSQPRVTHLSTRMIGYVCVMMGLCGVVHHGGEHCIAPGIDLACKHAWGDVP